MWPFRVWFSIIYNSYLKLIRFISLKYLSLRQLFLTLNYLYTERNIQTFSYVNLFCDNSFRFSFNSKFPEVWSYRLLFLYIYFQLFQSYRYFFHQPLPLPVSSYFCLLLPFLPISAFTSFIPLKVSQYYIHLDLRKFFIQSCLQVWF